MNYCAFCDNALPSHACTVTIAYRGEVWSFGYCNGCADRFAPNWDHAAGMSRRTWRDLLETCQVADG